jgi:tRNA pseudouridine32 synthase/23S rRNA pseudouridine746 synthase
MFNAKLTASWTGFPLNRATLPDLGPALFLINSQTTYAPPLDCCLDFIFRDESLLVVNKPSGLLSVPGRGADKADSLTSRVQMEFPDALSVHRLDMGTSGLLVLARGKEMHRRLSRLFRERKVKKSYIAMVMGRPEPAAGFVDLPLGSDWPNRPRQKVDFADGRNSLTRYRLLAHDAAAGTSRVELEPVTGRTHQLRVHMAAIGHSIIGDPLYGGGSGATSERLLLHASMLSFTHPFSAELLTIMSEAMF